MYVWVNFCLVIIWRLVIFLFNFVLLLHFVMAVFKFEFPHVLVRILHVVSANFVQDFFQIRDGLPSALGQVLDVVVLKKIFYIRLEWSTLLEKYLFPFSSTTIYWYEGWYVLEGLKHLLSGSCMIIQLTWILQGNMDIEIVIFVTYQ